MFMLHRPTPTEVEQFLARQKNAPFSYPHVGATWGRLPNGYRVDHRRVFLGQGQDVYERAQTAIRNWAMYPRALVTLTPALPPIELGQIVAPQVRLFGVWALTACRIVYVVDEPDDTSKVRRFGFAYGTLVGHPFMGEERFLVEQRLGDELVWYDLLAFSRPNHLLSIVAYPGVRRVQKEFGRRSAEAMLRAVKAEEASDALEPRCE